MHWDYLILTASHDAQAAAYERQLAWRVDAGHLPRVRRTLVVADPGGRRVGSGGSTLECLRRIGDLAGRRVCIVHAGGDSRRLPAYSPCGKIFVPIPGESESALGCTMFDRLVPAFLALGSGPAGAGQVVIAAGDALLEFDAAGLRLDEPGLVALAAPATPEEAARHGVFVGDRIYLQKPDLAEQARRGAIGRDGRTLLDIGVMSCDGATAAALLEIFSAPEARAAIDAHGLDLYREICCALGPEATPDHFIASARSSGSRWSEALLASVFSALNRIPLRVRVSPRAAFLHFGSTAELIVSGAALRARDAGAAPETSVISLDNETGAEGAIAGRDSWVEGCRVAAPLTLAGRNVVTGVDIERPLSLDPGVCLDVTPGRSRAGERVWFVRCYGVDDSFKDTRWFGRDIGEDLWTARLFPAVADPRDFSEWLSPDRSAHPDLYSAAEIAVLADQDAFHARRLELRARAIARSLPRLFSRESRFSAADLAFALAREPRIAEGMHALARGFESASGLESFTWCRVTHALGTATGNAGLQRSAFDRLSAAILSAALRPAEPPRNSLRPDETIWGRGPARIELGGGWTDTPPYTLEFGGDVANVAINLNGQPPIHCYCRVVDEPLIRISSIDGGGRLEIRTEQELADFRRPEDPFALAKAALTISGFAQPGEPLEVTLRRFGGGVELTTLVGIPKGSGLGTSSILGGVIMAVLGRLLGRHPSPRELFHDVLRLEQALTTGGGWQDQIGGGSPGAKITSTRPGMIPDPRIHYLPADLIDPRRNGGSTLLYYTGLTRLAKNILQEIVGAYFDRNRSTMAALAEEHLVAANIADALSRKDAAAFGRYVDEAWELQKRLCGFVTNDAIERLLARVRPHVHGMRISGAGSGGFLFMIGKSPRDAAAIRDMLDREPLNDRSRFFDFEVNESGIEVTTC